MDKMFAWVTHWLTGMRNSRTGLGLDTVAGAGGTTVPAVDCESHEVREGVVTEGGRGGRHYPEPVARMWCLHISRGITSGVWSSKRK